jgi:hypothetical protein
MGIYRQRSRIGGSLDKSVRAKLVAGMRARSLSGDSRRLAGSDRRTDSFHRIPNAESQYRNGGLRIEFTVYRATSLVFAVRGESGASERKAAPEAHQSDDPPCRRTRRRFREQLAT